jgi:hypothetical protein
MASSKSGPWYSVLLTCTCTPYSLTGIPRAFLRRRKTQGKRAPGGAQAIGEYKIQDTGAATRATLVVRRRGGWPPQRGPKAKGSDLVPGLELSLNRKHGAPTRPPSSQLPALCVCVRCGSSAERRAQHVAAAARPRAGPGPRPPPPASPGRRAGRRQCRASSGLRLRGGPCL